MKFLIELTKTAGGMLSSTFIGLVGPYFRQTVEYYWERHKVKKEMDIEKDMTQEEKEALEKQGAKKFARECRDYAAELYKKADRVEAKYGL